MPFLNVKPKPINMNRLTFKYLLFLVGVFTLTSYKLMYQEDSQALNHENSKSKTMDFKEKKYYQLVLIWVKDPAKFQEYATKVAPIVGKYGGRLDKMFEPTAIYAEGIEQPHIVNLVHYDTKEAYLEFEKDKDFQQIKHLREESIKMIAYEGYLSIDQPSMNGIANRVYNIELAKFKQGDSKPYKKYEKQGEVFMTEYGYAVEYKMDIDRGDRDQDFVKISFWNDESGIKSFEKHEAHDKIEKELYPNAVENLIWITARVHPMMLAEDK